MVWATVWSPLGAWRLGYEAFQSKQSRYVRSWSGRTYICNFLREMRVGLLGSGPSTHGESRHKMAIDFEALNAKHKGARRSAFTKVMCASSQFSDEVVFMNVSTQICISNLHA
jgi:hypothetical protein